MSYIRLKGDPLPFQALSLSCKKRLLFTSDTSVTAACITKRSKNRVRNARVITQQNKTTTSHLKHFENLHPFIARIYFIVNTSFTVKLFYLQTKYLKRKVTCQQPHGNVTRKMALSWTSGVFLCCIMGNHS